MKKANTFARPVFLGLCLLSIVLTSFTNPARPVPQMPIEQSGQFIASEVAASLSLNKAQIFSSQSIQELLQHPKAKALQVKYSSEDVVLVAVDKNMEEVGKLQLSFGIQPERAENKQPFASIQ